MNMVKGEYSSKAEKWYSQINWSSNPFTLEIKPELFVGYEEKIDKLLSSISNGDKFICILGATGAGKTTLLKWLEERYFSLYFPKPPSNKKEIVDIFYDGPIKPGFFSRLFRKDRTIFSIPKEFNKKFKGKKFLILLDEAHESERNILEWFRSLTDQIENCTLILAALPTFLENKANGLETLFQRITFQIYLDSLSKEEMIELIKKRISSVGGSGIEPFTLEVIEKIYSYTGGFPREVIKVCNELVKLAIAHGKYVIDASLFDALKNENSQHVSHDTQIKEREIHFTRQDENKKKEKIDSYELIESLTDKQKEIIMLLHKHPEGLTPPQIAKMIDIKSYKSEVHAIRSINNILKRLESMNIIVRSKRGRSYAYHLTPKIRSVLTKS